MASRVTADASTGLTVTAQVAFASPQAAVTVASPGATAVTLPVASTVATASSELVQVTVGSVTSSGDTVAVSVNSSPGYTSFSVASSVTADASTGLTVTVYSPVMLPLVAVILASPRATPVTTPCSSTVAMSGAALAHVTSLRVALSGATVAVRARVPPRVMSLAPSAAEMVTADTAMYSVARMLRRVTEPPL